MILQHQFLVNAGPFAVKTFNIAQRTQFRKIFITLLIFCQHELVITIVFFAFVEAFAMPVFHHIKFATDNGFHTRFAGFGYKFEGTKHVAMVSQRHCFHFVLMGFFHHVADVGSAIK